MENFHRGDPVAIERQYDVPARTAGDWHYHWVRDPEWRPWSLKKRRIAHQVFTPGEEFEIAQRIRDEISIPGTLFTDADFRAVAMEEYLARRWQEGEDWRAYSSFQDSKGFIAGFKKRNCFCSRRAHCKRRPVVDPARCAAWQQEIETLLATVHRDKIFNADETCWRLYPRDLGMTLHFIPAGMTDQFQPLDRRAFACLKSSARGYFMRTPRLAKAARIQKRQAIEILFKSWNRLSESVIGEAWSVYATE
jgi:hypothetical protein